MNKHYEESELIEGFPESVFAYVDDHANFSSHMSESSWMMGGGKMKVETDEGHGQKVDSHIKLSGFAFGIKIFLDEIVTKHEPPYRKEWQTVGEPRLLVIGHYVMGLEITPEGKSSKLKVYINYKLPATVGQFLLGLIFSRFYAKWCVRQMLDSTKKKFSTNL